MRISADTRSFPTRRTRRLHPALLELLEPRQLFAVDLAGSFTAIASPASGGHTDQATLQLQNLGDTRFNRKLSIDFYAVAQGDTFDPDTSTFLGEFTKSFRIGPGGSANQTLNIPLDPSLTTGDYTLVAVLDPRDRITESDESNNTFQSPTVAITHIDADIVPAFGSFVDIPSAIITGTATRGSAQILITNANTSTASIPSNTRMSIQIVARPIDAVDSSQDLVLGSQHLTLRGGPFFPGSTDRLFVPLSFPASLPAGVYNIVLLADTGDNIAESNEANNEVVLANRTLTIAAPFADPAVAIDPRQDFPTTIAANGQKLPINIDLSNNGTVAIPSNTTVSLAMVAHPTGGGDDIPLNTFSNIKIGGLRPGSILPLTLLPIIPQDLPLGSYTFITLLTTSVPGDISSNDSVATPAINVEAPAFDLSASIENTDSPVTVVNGSIAHPVVTVDVANDGSLPLPSGQRVNVAVALRPAGDSTGANDIFIGQSRNVFIGNLAPDDFQPVDVFTTIPFNVDIGDYDIVATITPNPSLSESDTSNNSAVGGTVSVVERFADIGIAGAGNSFGPDTQPGSSGIASVTLQSFGTIPVQGNVTVQIYASTTGDITGGQFIGSNTFQLNLAPGNTRDVAIPITLPGNLANVTLFAKILPSGFVDSAADDNIASAGDINPGGLTDGVDLTLQAAGNPFAATENGGVTAQTAVTVANVGSLTSFGSFTVTYFASTTGVIDANAINFGSITRTIILGPNTASLALPMTLTLPNPAGDTTYSILARVTANADGNAANDVTSILGTVNVLAV